MRKYTGEELSEMSLEEIESLIDARECQEIDEYEQEK